MDWPHSACDNPEYIFGSFACKMDVLEIFGIFLGEKKTSQKDDYLNTSWTLILNQNVKSDSRCYSDLRVVR